MTHGRRFPRWVYDEGAEPDVRFSLANERTFLAWIRTSLALLAVGIALEALDLPLHAVMGRFASGIFLVLGATLPVHAWISWARAERAMRRSERLPGAGTGVLVGAGTLLGAVAVLVGVVVR